MSEVDAPNAVLESKCILFTQEASLRDFQRACQLKIHLLNVTMLIY